MRSSVPQEERLEIKKKTHKNMMYLGIASIVMIFLGFSSGYYIARVGPTWVSITVPPAFLISSLIIVSSSITFFIALKLAKKGYFKLLPVFMVITLILGCLFVKYQWDGWKYLESKGMYVSDAVKLKGLLNNPDVIYGEDYKIYKSDVELELDTVNMEFFDIRDTYHSSPVLPSLDNDNTASSWMYILTIIHALHLTGGLISLIVVTIKSLRKKYNKNDIVGIQVSSIYWHFLDFLWLYLLFLLYYVG